VLGDELPDANIESSLSTARGIRPQEPLLENRRGEALVDARPGECVDLAGGKAEVVAGAPVPCREGSHSARRGRADEVDMQVGLDHRDEFVISGAGT
jgi:hypothetical protein